MRLAPPVGEDLPRRGFLPGESGFVAPPQDGAGIAVAVSPTSDRLQLLTPFPAWDGHDYIDLPVLVKAKGKCTTDHISAAGAWLRYRGHLENISGNLFLGVTNAFTGATGEGKDPGDGRTRSFADIAKRLAQSGVRWCAVGDENYGEGSSREHAAMEPRYRGGLVVLARSFARIHETNLKKQGLLPLTFADPTTYDEIGEDDRVSVLGLASLAPDAPVRCRLTKPDGSHLEFRCTHTLQPRATRSGSTAGSALERHPPTTPQRRSASRRRLRDRASRTNRRGWHRSARCAPHGAVLCRGGDRCPWRPWARTRRPWRAATRGGRRPPLRARAWRRSRRRVAAPAHRRRR